MRQFNCVTAGVIALLHELRPAAGPTCPWQKIVTGDNTWHEFEANSTCGTCTSLLVAHVRPSLSVFSKTTLKAILSLYNSTKEERGSLSFLSAHHQFVDYHRYLAPTLGEDEHYIPLEPPCQLLKECFIQVLPAVVHLVKYSEVAVETQGEERGAGSRKRRAGFLTEQNACAEE